ncbi:ricin B-like lectin R40G3 isoform X2 [Hibiscus syriacus]|uniref:ricin B-like lectin R40G3 isoform X2 n=1 Tax=Hibiscus syriacus TaxID=106335 RepID=UPI001921FC22|nr:ricin B-like lectin R40G3 isoform X2 [Hibiscus syriacus]
MEFPFGHAHHSHTHHHRNDDEDNRERPPPPNLHHHEFPPPSHHYPPPPNYQQPPAFDGPYPPPQPYFQQPAFDGPAPPYFQQPGFPNVHHQPEHSSLNYSPPPSVPHAAHESIHGRIDHHHHSGSHLPPEFHNKPTVKVYCKADPNYHLTIRDGKVILAPYDPSDEFQHWYKDEKFSTRIKDEVGFPSFSLVNKATGQVIKHSIGASHPVQLVPYKPDLDESVLWSDSKEVHDGYRAIRMINNIRLNFDAFHGDKKSGGIHNGTTIVLWQWNKGDNQIWRIAPY